MVTEFTSQVFSRLCIIESPSQITPDKSSYNIFKWNTGPKLVCKNIFFFSLKIQNFISVLLKHNSTKLFLSLGTYLILQVTLTREREKFSLLPLSFSSPTSHLYSCWQSWKGTYWYHILFITFTKRFTILLLYVRHLFQVLGITVEKKHYMIP